MAATSRHADCFAVAVCYRAYARVAGSEQLSDHLPAGTEELLAEPIHGVPMWACRSPSVVSCLMTHVADVACVVRAPACGAVSFLLLYTGQDTSQLMWLHHACTACSVRLCRQCGIDYSVRPRSINAWHAKSTKISRISCCYHAHEYKVISVHMNSGRMISWNSA